MEISHLFFALSAVHLSGKDVALGVRGQVLRHEDILPVLIFSIIDAVSSIGNHRVRNALVDDFLFQKRFGGFLCNNICHLL